MSARSVITVEILYTTLLSNVRLRAAAPVFDRMTGDVRSAGQLFHPRGNLPDELGLPVSQVAKVLDVRRAALSDLINSNAALLSDREAFVVKMKTLLNMQASHDA